MSEIYHLCFRVLSKDKPELDDEKRQELQSAESGAEILGMVPPPWNERLATLIGRPDLQLESLVMAQQFKSAEELLQKLPGLHNDEMLLHYARLSACEQLCTSYNNMVVYCLRQFSLSGEQVNKVQRGHND